MSNLSIASKLVRPPINPLTENGALSTGIVIVVTVLDGISKPYMDNGGVVWVKALAHELAHSTKHEQRLNRDFGRKS
ncbi:MAG: hypothetical protein WCF22_03020 [Candidatus Sulfotelmatobacter sp.]